MRWNTAREQLATALDAIAVLCVLAAFLAAVAGAFGPAALLILGALLILVARAEAIAEALLPLPPEIFVDEAGEEWRIVERDGRITIERVEREEMCALCGAPTPDHEARVQVMPHYVCRACAASIAIAAKRAGWLKQEKKA